MNIAGSGVIPAGEFNEKITVSGSARFSGRVRCPALSIAGSASGTGSIDCTGEVRTAGSVYLNGTITAQELHISGAFRLEDACVLQLLKSAGAAHFHKTLKAAQVHAAGHLDVQEGIEAEEMTLREGVLQCGGLLNAEHIRLELVRGPSKAESIGCGSISVRNAGKRKLGRLLSLFTNRSAGWLEVTEGIEGEELRLEATRAPLVVGDHVSIGKDCVIGLVQYRETVEIHPEARVDRTEKID